ncbi:hypothetical protein PIB30_094739, partial [Stylosanthes scabra]|nr:hypothetical protein [Stylosanthes scabra]
MDQNSGFRLGLFGSDPMILEAQIAARSKKVAIETKNKEEARPTGVASGPWVEGVALSSSSCPYPPGFGPCSEGVHVHHVIRAQNSHEIVCESPFVEGDRGCEALSVNESPLKSDEVNKMPPHEDEECSEETLCRINSEVLQAGNKVVNSDGVGEGVNSKELGAEVDSALEQAIQEEGSKETLYRMNVKAVAGIWDHDASVKNVVIRGLEIKGSGVANVNHVEETQASDTENEWVEGESATEEFWD